MSYYSYSGYYSYYGYGHYGPQFLDTSNELTGPGAYAYERATSPDGTIRTSYAHEGYDGSIYYHNVIEQNYQYRSVSSYTSSHGAETYHITNTKSEITGNFQHYSARNYGFNVEYIYGSGPGYGPHGNDTYGYSNSVGIKYTAGENTSYSSHSFSVTGYENGSSVSYYRHDASETYNGIRVPGSLNSYLTQTYIDPYGYATSNTH